MGNPIDPDLASRGHWIAYRAGQWAYVSIAISQPQIWGEDRRALQLVQTHLWGAHMCAMALTHVDSCLNLLGKLRLLDLAPLDLKDSIRRFRRVYQKERVNRLRNALEHEENWVAGLGTKGKQPYKGNSPNPIQTAFHSDTGLLYKVVLLDEEYNFEGTLEAVATLEKPLKDFSIQIWSAGHPRDDDTPTTPPKAHPPSPDARPPV